jgi:hypothetical protein
MNCCHRLDWFHVRGSFESIPCELSYLAHGERLFIISLSSVCALLAIDQRHPNRRLLYEIFCRGLVEGALGSIL